MTKDITPQNNNPKNLPENKWEWALLSSNERELIERISKGGHQKYTRFVLAVLGSISWVGGVLGAVAALNAEKDQEKINDLQRLWLQEHKGKIEELGLTIQEVLTRLDGFGEEIQKRIESPEYLSLVRQAFRSWDQADTQEKKAMFKKLITNAGAITLCPDDLVRLFVSWIEQYHESHFAVVKEVYQNTGITRGQIWDKIHPEGRPAENSAEADLFRYLISDLNIGRVIRQVRATNAQGDFLRRSTKGQRRGTPSSTMESAFEDTKPYELTGLGQQFVHYVMEDVVPQIKDGQA